MPPEHGHTWVVRRTPVSDSARAACSVCSWVERGDRITVHRAAQEHVQATQHRVVMESNRADAYDWMPR